ncbi:MAG: MBL fold metallo-hydrolase [Planctomycetia bacterium]|nr:MBL fold metallo-hydrolase [Planctomycetia bacterium]
MATITFIGVGSAFTTAEYYQSNALVTAGSGKRLLIDCGSDARFALAEQGIENGNLGAAIDGVYVTHLHADHVGGLEWLGLSTFFDPQAPRPKLFAAGQLIDTLWQRTLSGGMRTVEGKTAQVEDFFDCRPVSVGSPFRWEGIAFTPVQTIHFHDGPRLAETYGLLIQEDGSDHVTLFTADTQYQPEHLRTEMDRADLVLHDCETADVRSGVHAHYDDLRALPDKWKQKTWLYHYQPHPWQCPPGDGFCGFVVKGQSFDLATGWVVKR